jgi:hypothetical protein
MRVIRSSGSVRGGDGDIPAYSAAGFRDRSRFSIRLVEHVEPGIGIGLKNPAISGEMPLGMNAGAIR